MARTHETSVALGEPGDGLITAADQARIAEAISTAEKKTAGEIVAVVAAQSSVYLCAPFLWAAILALLVPWPLMFLTWWPHSWIYLTQLAVFLILLALFLPRRIRFMLVPKYVKKARAHQHALEQFLVQNLHTTKGRTGVLIFVSAAEHHAEILADTGIDAKVPKGTWQELVEHLTSDIGAGRPGDGFVHAIQGVGKHLAKHFPPGSADPNELPDHLIILR